jgi:anti-sigma factor RsiW
MIASLRRMVTCHWSARRIGRYLDADPSAPLEPSEVRRLETHLATCARCATVTAEHKALRRALARWYAPRLPDEAAMTRMHAVLERVAGDAAGEDS